MNLSFPRGHLAVSLMSMAWLLSACGGRSSDQLPATAIPEGVTISTTAAIAEVGDTNTFTNSAASLSGLTFAWNFGDGATSTEASPKHAYAAAGDFDVTLKVTNSAGASKDVKFKAAVNNRELVKDLSCAGDTQSGWCWQSPRPSGNGVAGIHFLSTQVGWTVGDVGAIHKTTDGGKTWIKQPSGVTKSLRRVRFVDSNNGWVLGDAGTVLHTSDGGAHWSQQAEGFWNSGGDVSLTVVSPAVAVIQGPDSKFQATTNGGANWAQRFGAGPLAVPSLVAPDGTMWAVNGDGLRKTTDFGLNWTLVRSLPNLSVLPSLVVRGQAVWMMSGPGTVPAQGEVQYVLQRSVDGGTTWEEFTTAGLPAIHGNTLDFRDANVGTVASDGNLYRTADAGRTWTLAANAADNVSPSAVYAVVAPGVIRRSYWSTLQQTAHQLSEDAGATWHKISMPVDEGGWWPDGMVQRVDAQAWVVLSSGQLALPKVSVSTDGMQTWRGVTGGLTQNLRGLWFFDAKRGVALTTDGELVETPNGGRDWAVRLDGLPKIPVAGFPARLPLTDRIQFVDAKRGWLLAGDAQFHQTLDGGVTWQAQAPLANTTVLNYQFTDASNGFAIGFGADLKRMLLRTTDAGKTWTSLSALPDVVRVLRFSDALHGVVAGDSGRILSTDDGGKTWVARREGDARSRLLSVTSNEAGSFWAAGSDGALLNSRDNGVTWTSASVGSTALLHKVRFIDALQGWVVGSGGTILATKDGGKTWSPQSTGTNVEMIDAFFLDSRSGWVVGRAGTEVYEYGTLMVTGTGGQ